MQPSGFRFTLASMMVGTAILGILSWMITGLMHDGLPWFVRHAFIVLVVFPLLFSASMTLIVTVVQRHLDGRDRKNESSNPTILRGREERHP